MEENQKIEFKRYKKIIIIGCVFVLFIILLVYIKNNKQNDISISETEIEGIENETLQEEIRYFEVSFNTTGGTVIPNQTIQENEKVIIPTNPIREGYKFIEWQLNGSTFNFDVGITQDIELIAIWEKGSEISIDTSGDVNKNNQLENEKIENGISYSEIGQWYKEKNGLSIKLNTYTKEETVGYISYKISYTLKNEVLNSKIMEGSFKLFFNDNTGEPQYGGFDYLYYGDEVNRSYEWKVLKSHEVYVLEYNAEEPDAGLEGAFFRNTPISTSLHWRTP